MVVNGHFVCEKYDCSRLTLGLTVFDNVVGLNRFLFAGGTHPHSHSRYVVPYTPSNGEMKTHYVRRRRTAKLIVAAGHSTLKSNSHIIAESNPMLHEIA